MLHLFGSLELSSFSLVVGFLAAGAIGSELSSRFIPGNATLQPFIVNPVSFYEANPLNRVLYELTHPSRILARQTCTNCTGTSVCCSSSDGCCAAAEGGCCPSGASCCPGIGGCCPSGQTCTTVNGRAGCCPAGQTCGGCPNASDTLCGESLCCSTGTQCASNDGIFSCTTPASNPPPSSNTTVTGPGGPSTSPSPSPSPSPQPNSPTPSPSPSTPAPTPSSQSSQTATQTATETPNFTPAVVTPPATSLSSTSDVSSVAPASTATQTATQPPASVPSPLATSSGLSFSTTIASAAYTQSFPPAPVANQVNATVAADDPSITYTNGDWKGSTACGETSKTATQANSTMQFNFIGTAVYMSTQVGPDNGIFNVFLDGQGVNVDAFQQTQDCVISWSSFNLPSQQHQVTVQFKGASVSSSGGSTAALDFRHFIITSDSTPGGPTSTITGSGGSSHSGGTAVVGIAKNWIIILTTIVASSWLTL